MGGAQIQSSRALSQTVFDVSLPPPTHFKHAAHQQALQNLDNDPNDLESSVLEEREI